MTARYVTAAEFDTFLGSETTVDVDLKALALEAAEQYLDIECGRRFAVAGASATARMYAPDVRTQILDIHDCTEITSVVENTLTLTEDSDYVAQPLNGLTDAGETRPYDRLYRYGCYWYTDTPKATVTVTAKWGWAAIPPGAKYACLVAAKAFLEAKDIRLGLAALTEAGGVGERQAKAVSEFIRKYQSSGRPLVAG